MSYRLIEKLLTPNEKKRFYWILFVMLVFSFFESLGLSLIIPYVGILNQNTELLHWINGFFENPLNQTELIMSISGVFLGLITLKFFLQIYVFKETSTFPYEFYKNKAQRNYRCYLGQPYLEYIKGNTGSYIKNCTNTIDQAANGLVAYLRYLSSLVTTIFLFALILLENFFVSASFIVLFSGIGFAVHKLSKAPQLRSGKEKEYNLSKLFQWISDTFVVFKEVKLYQKEKRFFSIFNHYIERLSKAHADSVYYPTLPPIYMEYLAMVVLLAVVGGYVFYDYPISEIVAPLLFYGAVGRRLLPSLTQAVAFRIQMQHFTPALECLEKELQKPLYEKTEAEHEVHLNHSLKFSNVHFFYQQGTEILKGIDFEIKKNQSIAIVGPSGAGKSTIVQILIGLLEPSKGKCIIDGIAYDNLNSITHLVGYVPQDIALMAGTILENITLFDEKVDEQLLQRAIEMAQLEGFIQTLSKGLQTQIGERGVNLSGGQKQRVGIARALYQQPDILLFDEATSSLDNISEALITDTIKSMAGKKTIIAIAHRLTTIQNFDQIYVLDQGRFIAKGTHDELLASCPLYQSLTKSVFAPGLGLGHGLGHDRDKDSVLTSLLEV